MWSFQIRPLDKVSKQRTQVRYLRSGTSQAGGGYLAQSKKGLEHCDQNHILNDGNGLQYLFLFVFPVMGPCDRSPVTLLWKRSSNRLQVR